MADIDALLADVQARDLKVAFSDLEINQLYPIKRIQRSQTTYNGKTIHGITVNIDLNGIAVFTYLPKIFLRSPDNLLDAINQAATEKKPFTVAYYGTIGNMNLGKIHKYGDELDITMVKKFTSFTESSGTKRKIPDSEDGPSCSKKSC